MHQYLTRSKFFERMLIKKVLVDKYDIFEDMVNVCKHTLKLGLRMIGVKRQLRLTEPSLKKILRTPFKAKDRTELYCLYRIYNRYKLYSEDWYHARHRFHREFKRRYAELKQSSKYTKKELRVLDKSSQKYIAHNSELELKRQILLLNTSDRNKEIIYRKYEEFLGMKCDDEEKYKIRAWLQWAVDIPHDTIRSISSENITQTIMRASEILDKELFGMQQVKEQILLFLSTKILNPGMKRGNLGLIGPPGTGKTAIARLIAKIMDLGFSQISFGGITNGDFLKGHSYTYIGSQPGEIVKSLKEIKHKNGVIFMDELEKAVENKNICSALLHIIDPVQNCDFRDNYLGEISIDLSCLLYVYSMNYIPKDHALSDRLWLIEIDGYSTQDKMKIIMSYILPKALENYNISKDCITFTNESVKYFIDKVSTPDDKGVRTIEKYINDIVNKLHFLSIHQNNLGLVPVNVSFNTESQLTFPLVLDNELLDKLLGCGIPKKEAPFGMYM